MYITNYLCIFPFICIIAYGLSFVAMFLITKTRNPLILLNLSVILISQLEGIFIFLLLKRNNKISFHNISLASTVTRLPERICVKITFIARKANGFPVRLAPYKVSPTKGCPIWLKATRI